MGVQKPPVSRAHAGRVTAKPVVGDNKPSGSRRPAGGPSGGATLRPWLARILRFAVPTLRVPAYNEVPDSKRVRLIAAVGT